MYFKTGFVTLSHLHLHLIILVDAGASIREVREGFASLVPGLVHRPQPPVPVVDQHKLAKEGL